VEGRDQDVVRSGGDRLFEGRGRKEEVRVVGSFSFRLKDVEVAGRVVSI